MICMNNYNYLNGTRVYWRYGNKCSIEKKTSAIFKYSYCYKSLHIKVDYKQKNIYIKLHLSNNIHNYKYRI